MAYGFLCIFDVLLCIGKYCPQPFAQVEEFVTVLIWLFSLINTRNKQAGYNKEVCICKVAAWETACILSFLVRNAVGLHYVVLLDPSLCFFTSSLNLLSWRSSCVSSVNSWWQCWEWYDVAGADRVLSVHSSINNRLSVLHHCVPLNLSCSEGLSRNFRTSDAAPCLFFLISAPVILWLPHDGEAFCGESIFSSHALLLLSLQF